MSQSNIPHEAVPVATAMSSLRSLSDASPAQSSSSSNTMGTKYNFQKKIELYKGSVSTVYKCLLAGGNPVVVKMYHKTKMAEKHFHKLEREIAAMRALGRGAGSSGVVQLLDTFEDTQAIYLVMECCEGGDLFKRLLLHGGKLPEAWVCMQVVAPLLRVLEHMHGLCLMHRDIKPENIFLTAEGNVKLGDFGLAMDWTKELPFSRSGTLDYMAPEVLLNPATHTQESPNVTSSQLAAKNIKPYTCAVDVWAVGCLAYELVCGRPPFEVEDEKQTASLIIYSNVIRFDPCGSAAWADFVTQALIKDPRQRPDARTLLAHPWVRSHLERVVPVMVRAAPSASHRAGSAASAAAATVVAAAVAAQDRCSRQEAVLADAGGERPAGRGCADARSGMAAQPVHPAMADAAPASLGGYSSAGGSSACGSTATTGSGYSSGSSVASSATGCSGSGSSIGAGTQTCGRPPGATGSGVRAGTSPLLVARTNTQQQQLQQQQHGCMTPPPPAAAAPSPAPTAAGAGHGMTASVPPQQRAPAPPGPFRPAAGSAYGSNPALRSLLDAFKSAALNGNGSNTGNGASSGQSLQGPPPPSRPVSAAASNMQATNGARCPAAASAAPSASCSAQAQLRAEQPVASTGGSSVAAVVGWRTPPASPIRQCGGGSAAAPSHEATHALPSSRDGLPPAPCPPPVHRAPSSANGAAGPAGTSGFSSPSRMPRCASSYSGASNAVHVGANGSSGALSPQPPPRPLNTWSVSGRSNSATGPTAVAPVAIDGVRSSCAASTSAGYVDQHPQPLHRQGSPGPLWATPASPPSTCPTSPLRRAHPASPTGQQAPSAASTWQLPLTSPPRREPPASPPRNSWVQPGSPTSAGSSLHELTRNWGAVVSVSVSKLFNGGGRRSGSGSAFASPQRSAPSGGKGQGLDAYGLPPPTPVASAMPPADCYTPKPVGVLERVKYHLRGGNSAAQVQAVAMLQQQQQQQGMLPHVPSANGVYVACGAPVAAVEIV